MPGNLEDRVRKTIRDYGMLAGGEHVLVAVSGGADSTALLLCLRSLAPELRLILTAAHLNHRIRGAEADADEDFVRRMSAGLGLAFVSETIDIKQQAKASRQNLEELARRARYDFLSRAAKQVGAQKVAVGHTLNDQAETALFRFIRGSGIEGLSAIHPVVEGVVIRPLLECSRSSILEYLEQKGVGYREDSTNKDFRHTRNRIRRELVPYLERHFNPQLVSTLSREARLARETWSFIESEAKRVFGELHRQTEEGIFFEIDALLRVHPALQKEVLRLALRRCAGSLRGVGSVHIDSVLSLCRAEQSGAQSRLPHGCVAMRHFNTLHLLGKALAPVSSFLYELGIPGSLFVPEAGAALTSAIGSAPDRQIMKERRSFQAFLEPSSLPETLGIRSRMPGDRYGGPGHRKVKKMLIDGKIPLPRRSVLPMVAAGPDVIWIPGFRPARGYEARPGAPTCVIITLSGVGPTDVQCNQ